MKMSYAWLASAALIVGLSVTGCRHRDPSDAQLAAAMPYPAETRGSFSIFGHEISWVREESAAGGRLRVQGASARAGVKVKFPEGTEFVVPSVPVRQLGGNVWEPLALFRQIFVNTQSETQALAVTPARPLSVALDPAVTDSWHVLDDLPVPIRAALREQLRSFARDHYQELASSTRILLESGGGPGQLPSLHRCLTLPPPAGPQSPPPGADDVIMTLREEMLDPCLGLFAPSMGVYADRLLNQPAPTPLPKVYYAHSDAARPRWRQPALILIHPSEDFHYPSKSKDATQQLIDRFHAEGQPVAFVFHDDNFNDATYYVRPKRGDIAFYSDMGKHLLCEDCPEVTFAGGYVDFCLAMGMRAYIANYFRDKSTGTIRLNLATDSIYTTGVTSPDGVIGDVTAADEVRRDGMLAFVRSRIGQFLENSATDDVGKAICQADQPISAECKDLAAATVLGRVQTIDRQGRWFPFMNENRFRIQIQVDGKEFAQPLGDASLPRTIIFNVLTARTVP